MSTPALHSKLPHLGTTIFATMSARAQAVGAINLGQGFPDFAADPLLLQLTHEAMQQGHNQYAPMPGLPALRQQISALYQRNYNITYNPDTEVTITSGATEALFDALMAVVHPGDEVLVLEPCYDSYLPAIQMCGGVPVTVPLTYPDYAVDWDRVRAAISPRTRAILTNTPHNPSGAVWQADDLLQLAALAEAHNLFVISDEVYEHLIFDNAQHQSVLRHPALTARSFAIFSFGKSLHVTGWKLGYCLAPAALTTEFRKVHQFVTFTSHTPTQVAIAQYMQQRPQFAAELRGFYGAKRDLFAQLLQPSRFIPLPTRGTYFQLYRYDGISDLPDMDFAIWLTEQHGVACIPVSAFYANKTDHRVVRFCFAKSDETLKAAAERLCKI